MTEGKSCSLPSKTDPVIAIPRGRESPIPEGDPQMTRAVVYLYTFLGLMQHRLEARKDRGATAVEYGLLVGLIAVVIIVAVTALGGKLTALFNSIVAAL
jgi:pilus assembly protein Flp/PilA